MNVLSPISLIIVLVLFCIVYLARRYYKTHKVDLTERYGKTAALLLSAARTAEHLRRKGDLDSFAKAFGIEIDLTNDLAVRDAVVNWVQKMLVANFKWGKQVQVSDIMIILHDLLAQDAHKGPLNPLEELGKYTVQEIFQYLPHDKLADAGELAKHILAEPVTDSRRRRAPSGGHFN